MDNLIKFSGQGPEQNETVHPKSIDTIINQHAKDTIEGILINLSHLFLTKHEIEILKPGLSFTPTPNHNVSELETDTYNLIKKLCLTFYFRDSKTDQRLR